MRILEKGEYLGTGPCLVSPLKLVSLVIGLRENTGAVDSGNCRLLPEMEELQSRCGHGSPAAVIVDDVGSPARDYVYANERHSLPAASAIYQIIRKH